MWVNTMLRERGRGRPSYLITKFTKPTENILVNTGAAKQHWHFLKVVSVCAVPFVVNVRDPWLTSVIT